MRFEQLPKLFDERISSKGEMAEWTKAFAC